MAYQLSTLRSRIQDKLSNSAFSTSILTQFVNDGLRDVVIQAKPEVYKSEANYTTSIGSNALTTSATDVLSTINLRVFSPINYSKLLPYLSSEDVDLYYPNIGLIGNGPPIAWTSYGMVLSLVNNSDQVYTLKSKYLTVPVELVNDADVPLLPVTYSEVLVLGGYKRALEYDDDFDEAQVVQQQIDAKLIDMALMMKPQIGIPHIMKGTRNRRLGWR